MTLLQTEEFREIPDELGKIISLHLNNKELEKRVIEEDEPMCKAIDDLIKDSKAEGRAEAEEEMQSVIDEIIKDSKAEGRAEAEEEMQSVIDEIIKDSKAEGRAEAEEEMQSVIDEIIKDSKAEGRAEGRAEGCESTFRCMSELMDGKKKDSLIEEGFELDVVEKAWNMLKSRKVIL